MSSDQARSAPQDNPSSENSESSSNILNDSTSDEQSPDSNDTSVALESVEETSSGGKDKQDGNIVEQDQNVFLSPIESKCTREEDKTKTCSNEATDENVKNDTDVNGDDNSGGGKDDDDVNKVEDVQDKSKASDPLDEAVEASSENTDTSTPTPTESNDNTDDTKNVTTINEVKTKHETSEKKHVPSLRNPFAGWKERADQVQQVLQNSDMLKAAQKNLEEKKSQLGKAVENNILNVNLPRTPQRPKKSTAIPMNGEEVVNDIIQVTDVDSSDEEEEVNEVKEEEKSGESKLDDVDSRDASGDKVVEIEEEIESGDSQLGDAEDDISYDDAADKSYQSEEVLSSQGSSIYIDSDDSSYLSGSDTSSVVVERRRRRRQSKSSSRSNRRNATGSIGSRSDGRSRSPSVPTAQKLFRGDLNVQIDLPQVFSGFRGGKTPRTSNSQHNIGMKANVASSYNRGRYTKSAASDARRGNMLQQLQRKVRAPTPPPPPEDTAVTNKKRKNQKVETQTALINKTYPSHILRDIVSKLSPGQYLMFLGNGMLGVNLKQTYLPGRGVYVDLLLNDGNAEKSGVIYVGDGLVKVGDEDVTKGTIFDVPGIIGRSNRPVLLTLNGEHVIKVEDMDYVAVAVGMVNRILMDPKQMLSKAPIQESKTKDEGDSDEKSHDLAKMEVSNNSLIPEPPSKEVRHDVAHFSFKRSNKLASFSAVSAACKNNEELQQALREAFRICCVDSRRLPFLAAFLKSGDTLTSDQDIGEEDSASGDVSASTRLMLYLELLLYRDLFLVATPKRRLDHAKRIIYKFILPKKVGGGANDASSDLLFDLRPMFPPETPEKLGETIKNGDNNAISCDFFKDIEICLVNSLAGAKFASFLLNDESAKMRAYMRGVSPYVDPSIGAIFHQISSKESSNSSTARNHLKHIVLYLLCQMENDVLDKNFERDTKGTKKNPKRLIGSAGGIACALFISRVLVPSIDNIKKYLAAADADTTEENLHQSDEEKALLAKCLSVFESFWESFLAPFGGLLDSSSYSNETYSVIEKVRKSIYDAANPPPDTKTENRIRTIVRSMALNEQFVKDLCKLRNELIYYYCVNDHPKYRAHIVHEWMCVESNSAMCNTDTHENNPKSTSDNLDTIPSLAKGCISRLVRRLETPKGISHHCPSHKGEGRVRNIQAESSKCNFNADFAIVFCSNGNESGEDEEHKIENVTSFDQSSLNRIACIPLSQNAKLQVEEASIDEILPVTLESYALVPTFRKRPFEQSMYCSRKSRDGHEVSLVNFMTPNANNTDGSEDSAFLYGVSLIFNYMSEEETGRNSNSTKKTVAITLVSERCVIPAMRKTLIRLYNDKVTKSLPNTYSCASLVEILESFQANDSDPKKLSTILEPYIKDGSSAWIDHPLVNQEKAFESSCLEVLVESLSPIPIALLFITALLEQKIVFTSSRRSALVSMVTGLRSLLSPLGWSHLIVPVAPAKLAQDLVQYPAPYILGIALDNKGSIDVLKTLPDDVTLVDVDVGRVILTQDFSHHFEATGRQNIEATTAKLRSQVLHLAESLGSLIGIHQSDNIWKCDSPLADSATTGLPNGTKNPKIEAVQMITNAFIRELCAGLNTCCYWIEEEEERKTPLKNDGITSPDEDTTGTTTTIAIPTSTTTESHVFFDEDRFLTLKGLRSEGKYLPLFDDVDLAYAKVDDYACMLEARPLLALDLKDFNLVMETFLRGQSFSSFVSSQQKESMAFW